MPLVNKRLALTSLLSITTYFFADLSVKESGMAELLPSVRVVIFDEAHQLNETGTQFLGEQLSIAQLLDLVRDILARDLLPTPHQRVLVNVRFRRCVGGAASSRRLR